MKKTMMIAAIPAMFALAACGDTATEEVAETETAVIDDDNDAPEPVAAPAAEEEEPHDESVPHDH
jgi:protein involved in sex pheromone biosynthesis